MEVRYPNIEVKLVGSDSSAFAIIGKVSGALKRAGVPREVRDEFTTEAINGDYENVLGTAIRWVWVT